MVRNRLWAELDSEAASAEYSSVQVKLHARIP